MRRYRPPGQWLLEPETVSWQQARLFVRFYRLLYNWLEGDGAAMVHWLRVEQPILGATPHKLMVDEDRLSAVVDLLTR